MVINLMRYLITFLWTNVLIGTMVCPLYTNITKGSQRLMFAWLFMHCNTMIVGYERDSQGTMILSTWEILWIQLRDLTAYGTWHTAWAAWQGTLTGAIWTVWHHNVASQMIYTSRVLILNPKRMDGHHGPSQETDIGGAERGWGIWGVRRANRRSPEVRMSQGTMGTVSVFPITGPFTCHAAQCWRSIAFLPVSNIVSCSSHY